MATVFREVIVQRLIKPSAASAHPAYDGFVFSTDFALLNSGTPLRQLDWPNPVRRINVNQDYVSGSGSWLFATGTPKRVAHFATLNPRKPHPAYEGFVDGTEFWLLSAATATPRVSHHSKLNTRPYHPAYDGYVDGTEYWLLAGVVQPFNQLDWPNPVRRVAQLADLSLFNGGTDLQLIGQDTFFGAPGQSKTYDWPNPRGPAQPNLRTQTNASVYYVVTVAPFAQLDWPNPRAAAQPNLGSTASAYPVIYTIVVQPFAQYNWPNPTLARVGADKSFTLSAQTQLIGQDTFFGAPGQSKSYDWPNPRGASQPNVGSTANAYPVYYTVSVQPFNQLDWPNPPRAAAQPNVGSTVNAYPVNYTVVVQPFAQYNWPNPTLAKVGADKSFALSAQTQLFGKDTFFGAPGEPPSPFDWPTPRGPVYRQPVGRGADNNTLFLFNLLNPFPFAQYDWPNPSAPRGVIDLKTFARSAQTQLFGQDQFFGAAGEPPSPVDWPNPRGPRAALQPEAPQYLLTLRITIQAPFAQLDWPNPIRATVAREVGFIDGTEFWLLATASPFAQYDWSNPRGPRAALQPSLSPNLVISYRFTPFNQLDWPNPVRAKPGNIGLRIFQRSTDLRLLGKDQFFGPPGMGPRYDWPNPQIPRQSYARHTNQASSEALLKAIQGFVKYARQVYGQATVAYITGRANVSIPAISAIPSTAQLIAGSPMTTTHDPIDYVCGDSWELTGPLNDALGNPLNLVGATISWKLDNLAGTSNLLTLSLGSGITITSMPTATIVVEASAAQTLGIPAGSYRDWLRVTLADGTVLTEWTGVIRAAANPT